MRARAKILKRKLLSRMGGNRCSVTTLTLGDDGCPLNERLTRLLRCFSKLRRQKIWKSSASNGAAVVEITRGQHGDHWHVHLHAIHTGKPFKRDALSAAWLGITGDSFIVHSRWVRDGDADAGYVATYATKGCSHDVLEDFNSLVEAVCALRGRRLFLTWGGWRGMDVDREDSSEAGWRRVGSFTEIARKAAGGDVWAIGVMRSLKVRVQSRGGQLSFVDLKPDDEGDSPAEVSRGSPPG